MPPYKANVSKAQQRKMFALAEKGDISMADAKGKANASKYSSLPEYARDSALKGLHHAVRSIR